MNQNKIVDGFGRPIKREVDKKEPWQLVLIDCKGHRQWNEKSIRLEFSANSHEFIPSSAWIGVHKDGRYIIRKWVAEEKGFLYEILK